jgi:hypothetical protein
VGGESVLLELVRPLMLESEYPNAHDQDVPRWWKKNRRNLREREADLLEQCEVHRLDRVDTHDEDCKKWHPPDWQSLKGRVR